MRSLSKSVYLVVATIVAVFVGLSGVSGVSAQRKASVQRANVAVTVNPVLANGSLVYEIAVTNGGKAPAQNTIITVPFDASKLRLEDVQFSGGSAWVTDIQPSAVTVQIERLNSGGDSRTISARFTPLVNLSAGAVLGDRVSYRWSDKEGNGNGLTNLPILNNGALFPLNVTPASAVAKTTRTFSSNAIFAPGEFVTMWYTGPDGKSVELEVKGTSLVDAASTKDDENGGKFVIADANGAMNAQFLSENLAPGTYSMVARGNLTGFSAVGTFEVK